LKRFILILVILVSAVGLSINTSVNPRFVKPAAAQVSTASIANVVVSVQATSLSLNPGAQLYIYGLVNGGGHPNSVFSNGEYASVTDANGNLIAALAATTSSTNSFTTQDAYYVIGGASVSGFSQYTASYGTNAAPAATGASDTFTVAASGSLVVVFGLGGGEQCLAISGVSGFTIDATDNGASGLPVVTTIGHSYLDSGTYTVNEQTQQCAAGQDPNNAGDLIGVFVFQNGQTAINSTTPPTSQAQNLYDDFTKDTSLNTGLWQVNGPASSALGQSFGILGQAIVNPTLTFTSNGMRISGVSSTWTATTIQSTQTFAPPFTAQAYVMATESNGNPFTFAIASSDSGYTNRVSISGNLDPKNDGYYGIWYATASDWSSNFEGPSSNNIVAAPNLNTWYLLTISVDASGTATLTVSQQGQVLGSTSGLSLGAEPFYVALIQWEALPATGGGPNQAYWQWVSVSSTTTAPVTYSATFAENNIPSGTSWGVTVGVNYQSTSSGTSITFSGLTGTVSYSYDSPVAGSSGSYSCTSTCSGSVSGAGTVTATYTFEVTTILGVKNDVAIKDFTIFDSGGTLSDCGVRMLLGDLKSCFSIQQNFYVQDPSNNIYWVQNIIVVGRTDLGTTPVWSGYLVFGPDAIGNPGNLLYCGSEGLNAPVALNKCGWVPGHTVVRDLTFSMTSSISNGHLTLSTNFSSFTVCKPVSPCLVLPKGSQILQAPTIITALEPQLDIVAECCSKQATFSSPTDGTIQSMVELSNGVWTGANSLTVLSPLTTGSTGNPAGTSTGETSLDLSWLVTSGNVATFTAPKSADNTDQGVGYSIAT
jgi:hypothetical protein